MICVLVSMMQIVITFAALNIIGQALRDTGPCFTVAFDQIGYMIADHRREPARLCASRFYVTYPGWCGGHHLEIAQVATSSLASVFGLISEPFDQPSIGKLKNQTFGSLSGGGECLPALSRDPKRPVAVRPPKLDILPF